MITNFKYKIPITVDNSANASILEAGRQQAFVFNNANMPGLFAHCKSDGSDIRVTQYDTTTLVNFYLQDFDYTNKTATIWFAPTVDVPAGRTAIYFIQFGNAAATAVSDFSATFGKPISTSDTLDLWNFTAGSGTTVANDAGAIQNIALSLVNTPTWGAGIGPWGNNTGGQIPSSTGSVTFNGSTQCAQAAGNILTSTPTAYSISAKILNSLFPSFFPGLRNFLETYTLRN